MRDCKTYTEAGVTYCFQPGSPAEEVPRGFREYEYNWENPNGSKGTARVYTTHNIGFFKLLQHWNRQPGWKYTTVPGQMVD